MLKRSNQDAAYCYDKAFAAKRKADRARTGADRAFWLNGEKRWLRMAAICDYRDRLQAFVDYLHRLRRRPH